MREQLDQRALAPGVDRRLLLVDARQQLEGVVGGQVVPELAALAEHRADPEPEPAPLAPRLEAEHARPGRRPGGGCRRGS